MKKLIIFISFVGLMSAASAQKFGFHGGYGGYYYAPRIGVGYGFYPYVGYGYPYYGYPYMYGRGFYRLQVQEENIRYDYQQKIDAARADKTIPRKQRRQKIRTLKDQRNQAINDLEYNSYNRRY
jgi:hypothetical protein